MESKGKNPVSFFSICNMPVAQINKLSKEQLTSALKDAIENFNIAENSSRRSSITSSPLTKDVLENSLGKMLLEHLKPVESKLASLLDNQDKLQKKCESLQNEIDKLKLEKEKSAMSITAELEQRHNRRLNVIIAGLKEGSDGGIDDRRKADEESVEELLRELKVDPSHIKSSGRIGRLNAGKPRLLRLTLDTFETKMSLLKSSKSLKYTSSFKNVFVNNDLTPDQQKQDKALRDELKKERLTEKVLLFTGMKLSKNES